MVQDLERGPERWEHQQIQDLARQAQELLDLAQPLEVDQELQDQELQDQAQQLEVDQELADRAQLMELVLVHRDQELQEQEQQEQLAVEQVLLMEQVQG